MAWWEILLAILGILGSLWSIFTPSGRAATLTLVDNLFHGRFDAIIPHFSDLSPLLINIEQAAKQAFAQFGSPIANDLIQPFQKFAKTLLDTQRGALASAGMSTPQNAQDTAATAFTTAFGAGLSSAAVTAIFESLLPEKLNTLNGVGPIIAQLAGFSDVANRTVGPLYDAAFGTSLKYSYLEQFRPNQIDINVAREAFRRRFISQAQFEQVCALNGLAPQWVATEESLAFAPIPARLLASSMDDTQVDPNFLAGILKNNGYSDADTNTLVNILQYASYKSARKDVQSSAEANFVAGILDEAGFETAISYLNVAPEAKGLIELAATQKRLLKLTEDYKAGWDAKFLAQEISLADYRVALAGLGYTSPIIDGIVGGMSARLDAIEFKGEAAETKAQRRKDQELAITAAMTAYRKNEIDLPALTAALTVVAGLPAEQIALYVALATARGRVAQHTAAVKRTATQTLAIKAASEEYLKGVINTDTLTTLLKAQGMDQADVNYTIAYLDARGALGQNLAGGGGTLRRGVL